MPPFEKNNQFSTGRPRGARNKAVVWREAVGGAGTEKVIRRVQKEAERGNMYAAALVLACQFASNRDPLFASNRDPSGTAWMGLSP